MSVCQPSPEKKRKVEQEDEVKSIASDMESEVGQKRYWKPKLLVASFVCFLLHYEVPVKKRLSMISVIYD